MPKISPAPPKPLSDAALALIAKRFHALSEPTRLRLLNTLMAGPKNVTHLVAATGSSQANTSKHLAVLREAGMVASNKDGLNTIYQIADPTVYQLCQLMCDRLRDEMEQQAKTLFP